MTGLAGMDRETGRTISGVAYLRQRLANALGTPIGTTVMHRDRGSAIPRKVDGNATPSWVVSVYADAAAALVAPLAGVPDFVLERIQLATADSHQTVFDLTGVWLPEGRRITLEGIQL